MKTQFIPIDYDYFDFDGRNYIKIFGRNEKGKRICVIDTCDIFFWAILKDNTSKQKINTIIKKLKKVKVEIANRVTTVKKVEVQEKKFLDKEVTALKIFADNYKDLHAIADHLGEKTIEKRRGYDLGFITHYIIEKQISPLQWYEIEGSLLNGSEKFGAIDKILDVDITLELKSKKAIQKENYAPKVLCYDLETDQIKIGQGEILMVSLVGENFKKVITTKRATKKETYVEYVKDEKELLETFVQHTKKISPDFLVGYFSDGFDMPYLKERAKKNNVKLPISLDGSPPVFSRGVIPTAKTKGIAHIDLLRFIRTAYGQYMQSESFSLNEVAKEFLGEQKKEFTFKPSSQIKDEEWDTFFSYNLHDSVLVYNLFEKFWPDIVAFSKVTHEPPAELTRAGLSRYVESYMLHNLHKYNEIPEKKPTNVELAKRRHEGPVEGAFVFEPKPGLYENIVMFDFTSMHTSIIISMNLSKGTLLLQKTKNANSIETKRGTFSFTKKAGFLPLLLKEIFETRKKFKSEYKKNPNPITKARSNAFKVLSASVHGYIAFFGARYYSKEASAAILAYVRKFNKDTIKNIEKKGYNVLYGDTDSIAFVRNNDAKAKITSLLKELNSKLPGIMELELEGFFKRGLWVTTRAKTTGAKKKYALIAEDNKIKIRGFETVRRDWCTLARSLQNNVIELILKNGNEKKALDYTKKIIAKIKKREISTSELIIKSQLRKPITEYKAISPHVTAAQKMKAKGIAITPGTLISYYVSESNQKSKLIRDRVKLPDEKGTYDIVYYLQNQILPAVENIFEVFGINVTQMIDGKKQMTLEGF